MNDIPLCAQGHPMEVTSCTNGTVVKPYSCSGTRCPARNAKTMDNAPHYFICKDCFSALCPRCAIDQSQIYKLLLSIDQLEAEMVRARTPFMHEGRLWKKGMGRLYRPWAERSFILDAEGTLGYYHGGEMRGAVNVRGSSLTILRACEADGRNFAFSVVSPQVIHQSSLFNAGELILAAESMEEAADWCARLQLAIRKAARAEETPSEAGEEEAIKAVRRPSASGGLMATPEAMAAKADPRSSAAPPESRPSKESLSGGLLAAASAMGGKGAPPGPSAAAPSPGLRSTRAASVQGRGQSATEAAEAHATRELHSSLVSGVTVEKKFSSEGTYKPRLVWLDGEAKTFNWSKQDTKSDQFKFVDLVSVSACAREAPKKKPLGADAGRMEADGLCVHMTVSKRYQSREGAADTKGGGVDLRFSSAALAKAWVETVNRLRADAATIFTGVRVDKKLGQEATYKARLIWLDESAKTFNWSKESSKSERCKAVDLIAVEACGLEVPQKSPLTASRSSLEGFCVCLRLDPKFAAQEGGESESKGGCIDLRFASTDIAANFVDTLVTLKARAVATRAR